MTGEVWSVDTGQHLGVITQELGVRSRQLHHPIISVRQVRFGQFPHRGTQGFLFTGRWPGQQLCGVQCRGLAGSIKAPERMALGQS
ncbi:hypothetical protein RRG08_061371 [Elysia crispata]|uniref:Uncharacterized protein n=1 Tax=Elysia crispata TaxID=231223 RepID=A0AAE1AG19_9GAST|nr:hypothetical protein RRG08_061371 [Elysia crispata]